MLPTAISHEKNSRRKAVYALLAAEGLHSLEPRQQ